MTLELQSLTAVWQQLQQLRPRLISPADNVSGFWSLLLDRILRLVIAAEQLVGHVLHLVWQNLPFNVVKNTSNRLIAKIVMDYSETKTIFSAEDNRVGFEIVYGDQLFHLFQRLHSPEAFVGDSVAGKRASHYPSPRGAHLGRKISRS